MCHPGKVNNDMKLKVEVTNSNDGKVGRQNEDKTKKVEKPRDNKNSMNESNKGEKESKLMKGLKIVNKIKRKNKRSSYMLLTGDCALRV